MYLDLTPRYTRRERWRLRGVYVVYQIAIHLLLPVFLVILALRTRKEPLYGAQWWNRFGFIGPRTQGRVFIFAASLGETRAATPVIARLLARGETILLTHSSAAGLAEARRAFPSEIADGRVVSAYVPFDMFWALSLFYHRHRPKLGLVVEAELWPAMLVQAARVKLPMFQINGNYTERGFTRDSKKLGGARLLFWRLYQGILTKSPERAERYLAAGMPPESVQLVGELKFDQQQKEPQIEAAKALLATHPAGAPVFGIASSIEGEEAALLAIVAQLRGEVSPAPRIVWVPRSPQRFEAVCTLLQEAGVDARLRSAVLAADFTAPDGFTWPEVLVGDSIGEMDFYYSLCDLMFVGATLYPMGGHNIIEPLALNKPVVTGPSIHGILYPALEAIEAGALRKYENEQEMGKDLVSLFSDVEKLQGFAAKTGGFHGQHKGAADRTVSTLAPYLEADHG
ncbi:3-deoxy-D-manno-octulosonic acid transferase [Pseudoruegeria sp. SHC-113]|uniref:3-deoxy-D-manno-octulosonic acid transferase n=1 Tax=Pseudoruegeria sp. SHC-113 TaxID=2855439 RepID=UPI0021BADC9F|nr:glycosyltransferase N-terminal domain-containing protein [Pseudoruegeria sp. SHC-113]MCT8161322.1 3-deoxy-D-manno-octulosonic acid transferase [Pseudoruegeria sp. SHC-113]